MNDNILKDVSDYYAEKLRQHGKTPAGVDWNSQESQELRFSQLLKVLRPFESNFSLLDYGCGYGALLPFLKKIYPSAKYLGFDCEQSMLLAAKEAHADDANWLSELPQGQKYDYIVASGIFNVRLLHDDKSWSEYVKSILSSIDHYSKKGFSFNMLTSYSDVEFMRNYLFYADPKYWFDFCKKSISKYVTILHDYPLYEFTIIVRKS